MAIRFISDQVLQYLKHQLEAGNSLSRRRALQRLSYLYRRGFRIRPQHVSQVENTLVGLLYTQHEEKVTRWILNCLARFGTIDRSSEAIVRTVEKNIDNPDIVASGVSALYSLRYGIDEYLSNIEIDNRIVTLASLQYGDISDIDFSILPLDAEKTDPSILKLGLVLVGLDKAPENLFDTNHSNRNIVRDLCRHDDSHVSQYSVWAIAENQNLKFSDLGLDLKLIESFPSNIRAWIMRLLGMTPTEARKRMEYVRQGSEDSDPRVRAGLAMGLRDTYFDGIDALMINWLLAEDDNETRQCLLDHFVISAEKCDLYKEYVIDAYTREADESIIRRRIEAAAAGTALFRDLQKIRYSRNDLFSGEGGGTMARTININTLNAGALAIDGNINNSGAISAYYRPEDVAGLNKMLALAEGVAHEPEVPEENRREVLHLVDAARKLGTPDSFSRVVTGLKRLGTLGIAVQFAGVGIEDIIHSISTLAGLL